MALRGVKRGSLGIDRRPLGCPTLQLNRADEGFVVSGDRLAVFFEATEIGADRVLGHPLSFSQRSTIGNTAGQGRHENSKSAFWFWSENDVIAKRFHR